MTGLIAAWTDYPVEVEILVALLFLAIATGATWLIATLALTRNGTDPLRGAVLATVADSLRWIGAIALLVGVFGFFLGMEPGLARMTVDPGMDPALRSAASRRITRLLGAAAATCAAGFLLSWWLTAWVARWRDR